MDLAINGEEGIGCKTAENETKWLPLGGCSCIFFFVFCREQKVISCAARHAKARQRYAGGRGTEEGGGKATHFLRERWRAYCRSRCTGDGEVTNYSSLSAAPVFKARAFHPGNQAARLPEFLVRLSIINLRRQCLQHPSVTSSRISFVQSSGSLCRPRPKVYEAFTVPGVPPSTPALTIVFRRKELLSQFPSLHLPSINFKRVRVHNIDDTFCMQIY